MYQSLVVFLGVVVKALHRVTSFAPNSSIADLYPCIWSVTRLKAGRSLEFPPSLGNMVGEWLKVIFLKVVDTLTVIVDCLFMT